MSSATEIALQKRVQQLERENAKLRDHANTESHSRLMAEEELGKTENQLQIALDAAGLAMWQWDLDAQVIYTSRRFADMVNDFGNMQGDGQEIGRAHV